MAGTVIGLFYIEKQTQHKALLREQEGTKEEDILRNHIVCGLPPWPQHIPIPLPPLHQWPGHVHTTCLGVTKVSLVSTPLGISRNANDTQAG